jgi:hypothetical protein
MANKRHKNRLMKKYFWRLGYVEARIEVMPEEPTFRRHLELVALGCASLIGPWNKHFFRSIHERPDRRHCHYEADIKLKQSIVSPATQDQRSARIETRP